MKIWKNIFFLLLLAISCSNPPSSRLTFSITFSQDLSDQAQDGRLLLMLANNSQSEPRFQINDGLNTQLVFGTDVEGMQPGEEILVDGSNAFGFPIQSLNYVPPGEYFVQALINRYETFSLKTGHTVKLPPDHGEGQQWNRKPGNFYSRPIKITLAESQNKIIKITMDQKIEPIEEPKDTRT